jgi:biopolymer transport protein ExbD
MESAAERGRLKSSPNVTPLVDVVLVLLILFIVMVPAVDASVRLPRAKHASPREGPGEAIFLILAGSEMGPGRVQLEVGMGQNLNLAIDTESGKRALVAALQAQLAEKANAQIYLKADGRLSFRHIQSLFDLCREAGAEVVSAVTASDQSQSTEGGLS